MTSNSFFIGGIFLLGIALSSNALECYFCEHIDDKTENGNGVFPFSDKCRETASQDSKLLVTCPDTFNDNAVTCGNKTATWLDGDVKKSGIRRGCVVNPIKFEGCNKDSTVPFILPGKSDLSQPGFGVPGAAEYKTCFCAGDNCNGKDGESSASVHLTGSRLLVAVLLIAIVFKVYV